MLKQALKPLFTNKFSICGETQNLFNWKQIHDFFENTFALGGVAVTCFVQVDPSNWECNAFEGNSNDQKVNVNLAKFSVCMIHS